MPPTEILESRNEAGAIVARVPWRDGVIDGTLHAGAPGQAGATMTFVAGVAAGPMRLHNAQGRVTATATLAAGKLEGPMTLFDAAGRPVRRLHYVAGELVREDALTLAGKLVTLWKSLWP